MLVLQSRRNEELRGTKEDFCRPLLENLHRVRPKADLTQPILSILVVDQVSWEAPKAEDGV